MSSRLTIRLVIAFALVAAASSRAMPGCGGAKPSSRKGRREDRR